MEISCRLEPMEEGLEPIFLPDRTDVFVGRQENSNIQNVFCSRQQILCVANYKEHIVNISVVGRPESIVDKVVIPSGTSCFAGHSSIIELLRGGLKYRVVFYEGSKDEALKREALKRELPKRESPKREKFEDSDFDSDTEAEAEREPSPQPVQKKPFSTFTWDRLFKGELLIGTHFEFEPWRSKVAAFDLDGTLIRTRSGNVFPKNMDDWTIWHDSVVTTLTELQGNGYQIVLFTNQASLNKSKGKMLLSDFQKKVERIIGFLGVPVCVYISTGKGFYRKPAPGMWEYFISKMVPNSNINMTQSFYVGDAAGRPENWKPGRKGDFSASDRMFALNICLRFLTPEEFFLKEAPVEYPALEFHPGILEDDLDSQPKYQFPQIQEVILMVGSPASGKSHFVKSFLYRKRFSPVSRDILGSWQKCVGALTTLLESKRKAVIDNTNPDIVSRKRFIEICQEKKVPIRCFWMKTTLNRSLHNNQFRQITDPTHSVVSPQLIRNFYATMEPPTLEEGFSEIVRVPFVPIFPDPETERKYNYLLVG